MTTEIIEINVHGMTTEQAIKTIYQKLDQAKGSDYRIRVIHGFHGGTRIRDGIEDEFSYGRNQRVKRIRMGDNPGICKSRIEAN